MVYFLQGLDGGTIKIGHSRDPLARAISVQYDVRKNLKILATMPGDRPEEQAIHARFASHRVRGEWFQDHPDILSFIAENASPWTGPPTVGRPVPDGYWEDLARRRKIGMSRRRGIGTREHPAGPILLQNLYRLGFADRVVRASEVAQVVSEKTGKPINRHQVTRLLGMSKIEPRVIAHLAEGLGVDPDDLVRRPPA